MKRAELARRQAEATARDPEAAAAAPASLETAAPAPALTLAEPAPPPSRPTLPGTSRSGLEAANREAAQLLFEAKTPQRDRRRFYAWLALATACAAAALGAWVWWQMQATSSIVLPAGTPAPRPAAAPEVLADPAPAAVTPLPARPPERAATPQRRAVPPAAVETPAPAAASKPILVTRTPRVTIHPGVSAGYQALAAGDVEAARRHYLAALRDEPSNVDALHGMAAIALRDGRPGEAASLYRRILELAPRDSAARGALASLGEAGDDAESSLKSLLAAQPQAPATQFALGNALAARQRWREAQEAYFAAHTGDPANPDYLFNLAVSLDQLHQAGVAAQYYRRALEAARQQPAAFDPVAAAARLDALEDGR